MWPSTRAMMEAVLFGHEFLAPTFQAAVHNALVNALLACLDAVGEVNVTYLFKSLPADNALLELVVVLYCYYGADKVAGNIGEGKREVAEYWRRVTEKGLKVVDPIDGARIKACEYHVHEEDKERMECEAA